MSEFSEERLAPANGIEIAYQEMGDPGGEPLLLIMGLGTQMIAWEEDFCAVLAGRGFRVVRFDNRDVGHSTMIDSAGRPKRTDMIRGRRSTAPYFLVDMAEDAFGLMDHLGIEAAHVTGASMGGMIAQTMAIHRPERVRSLVSIMSTTGSRWTRWPTWKAMAILLSRYPRSREAYVEQAISTFSVIGSPAYPLDEERLAKLAGEMYDRSLHPIGILRRLEVPTTVLHGSADPMMRPVAGRATARAIPGARLRMFEGMGHDLPRQLWPEFVDEIAAAAERAPAEGVKAGQGA